MATKKNSGGYKRRNSNRKTSATSSGFIVFVAIIVVVAIAVGGIYYFIRKPNTKPSGGDNSEIITSGELSIHFLELGNEHAGDCVYIKAGETDVLIDAGSKENSLPTITSYVNKYVKDGVLEYTIITHADEDHIAGFSAKNGIFSLYECKTIIDFCKSDKSETTLRGNRSAYGKYLDNRTAEVESGAKHFTALDCCKGLNGGQKTYQLADGVSMEILYQKYYETNSTDENNYSVCLMIKHGSRNFLFTGDLEEDGEKSLVENNNLPQVELYKAGHHGSKTSSTDRLLSVIKPKIVCVSCCAGSVEYTQSFPSTFPTQAMIDRVSRYTDKVYVTTVIDVKYDTVKEKYVNDGKYKLLNGNIVVLSNKDSVTVNCSNNNTILKDTEWFKNNRTWKIA